MIRVIKKIFDNSAGFGFNAEVAPDLELTGRVRRGEGVVRFFECVHTKNLFSDRFPQPRNFIRID